MLPTTWTALLLLLVAVLPGATFTFGFERQVSAYGVTLADRVLRFVAVSVVFDLLLAWPAYLAYRLWIAGRPLLAGQFTVAWVAAAMTTVVPALLGSVVGGLYVTRGGRTGWAWLRRYVLPPSRERRLLKIVLGGAPAPRAWDNLFSQRPVAYLRVRTTTGGWLAGRFGPASYAGGFPHEPDLLLEEAWPVDAAGRLGDTPLGYPVYISAGSIAYVDAIPAVGTNGGPGHV